MSKGELGRVEALARVRSKQLRLVDATRLMRVCYRQAKRLWKRYREEGAAGLKHRSAGRRSHHAYEPQYRGKVLRLGRENGGGTGVGASARSILGRWCRWTGAFTGGWRNAAPRAA